MEGSYLYNPFYPQSGGNSGISPQFRILSFTNNAPICERGVAIDTVTFNWSYTNGVPLSQSIEPLLGVIPSMQRQATLNVQNIVDTVTFTLTANNGAVNRNATSVVRFVDPIFMGVVPSSVPVEDDILAMNKRISLLTSFRAMINNPGVYSCFASPMANPIIDIRETLFGISIWNSYVVIDNFMLTMADGLVIPYRVVVRAVPEHTLGMDMALDIIFEEVD